MTKNCPRPTDHTDEVLPLAVKMSHSFNTALHFLLQLSAQGVRDIVLCAGSRSAPLAYAALLAEQQGEVRLHTCNDERAAGFYALGIVRAAEPAYLAQATIGKANKPVSAVAVITTSGSAPGHLLPAILEAEAAGLPIIVISADRPHYLRGVKASQTTRQTGMFAEAVRETWELPAILPGASATDLAQHLAYTRQIAVRATSTAQGIFTNNPGPVHVNMAFADPIIPTTEVHPDKSQVQMILNQHYRQVRDAIKTIVLSNNATDRDEFKVEQEITQLSSTPLTLVVAGDRAGMHCPDLLTLCTRFAWPIWAQPGSMLNFGAAEITKSILVYTPNEHMFAQVERVIVVGAPTLSRPQMNILRSVKTVWVVDNSGSWADAGGVAQRVYTAKSFYRHCLCNETAHETQTVWCEAVIAADKAAQHKRTQQLLAYTLAPLKQLNGQHDEEAMPEVVSAAMPVDNAALEEATPSYAAKDMDLPLPFGALRIICQLSAQAKIPLVLAASSVVRDAQIYAQHAHIFTNRGLAGIDGTLAFAKGLARGLTKRVMVALGDQAFMHDFSALFRVNAGESALDVFVFDDNGGGIFAGLEHGKVVNKTAYNRIFGLGEQHNIAGLAQAIGAQYWQVSSSLQLAEIIRQPAETSVRIWHITYDLFTTSCLRRHIQI